MRALLALSLVVGCGGAAEPSPTCGHDAYQRTTLADDSCERGDLDACVRTARVYEEGGYSAPTAPAVAAVLYVRACRGDVNEGCMGLARLVGVPACSGEAFRGCIDRLCERNVVAGEGATLGARTLIPAQRDEIGCRP